MKSYRAKLVLEFNTSAEWVDLKYIECLIANGLVDLSCSMPGWVKSAICKVTVTEIPHWMDGRNNP